MCDWTFNVDLKSYDYLNAWISERQDLSLCNKDQINETKRVKAMCMTLTFTPPTPIPPLIALTYISSYGERVKGNHSLFFDLKPSTKLLQLLNDLSQPFEDTSKWARIFIRKSATWDWLKCASSIFITNICICLNGNGKKACVTFMITTDNC